jgi:hypothetical protein
MNVVSVLPVVTVVSAVAVPVHSTASVAKVHQHHAVLSVSVVKAVMLPVANAVAVTSTVTSQHHAVTMQQLLPHHVAVSVMHNC